MFKKIYLSPFGRIASAVQNMLAALHRPFMVYGYRRRSDGKFLKLTRISSTAVILEPKKLEIADNVWVWHHSIIDASNGISIGRGCQVGAWVGIFTHGSHLAIRLLGGNYINLERSSRVGYQRGPVEIGEYTFIGAQSLILPGVKIGRGCLIAAGSIVTKSLPDFSVASGNPAEVVGDTRRLDRKYFSDPFVQKHYFAQDVMREYLDQRTEPAP